VKKRTDPYLIVLLLAMIPALWVRVRLATAPFQKLVATFLSDDAFYYFGIARNILAGNGASFDGVIPTNGFHPLYMLVLLPIFGALGGDPIVPIYVALILLSATNAVTAVLVYLFVRELIDRRAALVAAVFWLSNPYSAAITLTGVEAALVCLFLSAAALSHLRLTRSDPIKTSALIRHGLLLGLLFLSRTDSVFILAAVIIDLLILWRGKGALRRLLPVLGTALAATLPWLIWSLVRTGSLVQISGKTLMFRSHTQFLESHSYASTDLLRHVGGLAIRNLDAFLLRLCGFQNTQVLLLVVGVCIGVLLAIRATLGNRIFPEGALRRSAFLLLGVAAIWLFYVLVFWQVKPWYFLSTVLALAVLWALIFHGLDTGYLARKRPAIRVIALAVWIAFFAACHWERGVALWKGGFHPWQSAYLDAAFVLRGNKLPRIQQGDLVGAFNAGILGYFGNRRIVNLDGVVNDRVLPAMRQKRFLGYLHDEGVRYLVDHEGLIDEYAIWSEESYGESLRFVARFPTAPFAGDVTVVEVR